MHEFMMYSLGVPLSKSYMTNFFATIQEKIWRMYKVHADFEELPIESQMKVMLQIKIEEGDIEYGNIEKFRGL